MNFSPALTVANTIEILGEDYATANFRYTVTVDGTTTTKDVDQGQPATFNVSGSLTQITVDNNNSNGRTYLEWIKVDGKELIDSNVTINTPSVAPTGCSIGTKQGFSIIKYTGPNDTDNHTVPHGLSQEPNFIITKNLDTTFNWDIYHSSLADDKYLIFTNAEPRNQGFSGRPTSTVFKTEHDYSTNENEEYIANCWHDVPGLQKFGNYLSEGGNDANYVPLGFRPAILWIKSYVHVADTTSWCIFTDEVDKTNPFHNPLYANHNAIEGKRGNNVNSGTFDIDLLSDGFKIRTNVGEINEGGSGDYYLYCAWAKEPTFNLYGGQSNAR